MKKKILLIMVLCITIMSTFIPVVAFANMAAPQAPGLASNITFAKNDDISVKKEVLDIVVGNSQAEITATYHMKNTSAKDILITSMFLSPNIENERTPNVTANNVELEYKSETYHIRNSSDVKEEDGKYIIVESGILNPYDDKVDTIEFEIPFKANEEVVVSVNYVYNLGGYPKLEYNSKYGEIEYYLSPASLWKDFSDLTINLTLDPSMPVIKSSTLEFEKIDDYTYQYKSTVLPKENLKISIDQTGWQEFVTSFKSPYLAIILIPAIIGLISIAIIVVAIILIVKAHKRSKKKKANSKTETIDKKNL